MTPPESMTADEKTGSGTSAQSNPLDGLYHEVQSWFERDDLAETVGLGDRRVETIALDWLAKAGKRWRPFLSVCMLQAVCDPVAMHDQIRRIAIALECIHKASLIYDDIQDNDDYRYGEPTVHTVVGVPLAMTSSLLLMGHGYRMLAELEGIDGDIRAEMLVIATQGHCDLCLGQGTELAWMQEQHPLPPAAVLDIFKLKTAPSFDVVFRLPLLCGNVPAEELERMRHFCEIIGTAYQINDDLDDFHGDGDVDDLLSGRPSIVLALAYEAGTAEQKQVIERAWCQGDASAYDEVKQLLVTTGAADKAAVLLVEHLKDAKATVAAVGQDSLRTLLIQASEMVFARLAADR